MKKLILVTFLIFVCCKEKNTQLENDKDANITVVTESYELVVSDKSQALLIVFPGGGATAKETKQSFKIVKDATDENISVLLMNFNRHLWIEQEDMEVLSNEINQIVEQNNLNPNRIFIGGMSIGGTVALTLSNYLAQSNLGIKPKGVFVVDSPIDLYALYESSEKDITSKKFSEERLAEPKFIINYFEDEFGSNDSLLTNIQKVSPITLKTSNKENIEGLKNTKLRFYTEPDTLWWEENRQTDFESTNAYVLQKTSKLLRNANWTNVQLIQTKNKGYRIDGERHPHSWSIVDTDNLIDWILE